jgi:hypothetical protein
MPAARMVQPDARVGPDDREGGHAGRLTEDNALGERVAHGVARPLRPRGLFEADDEHLGRDATWAKSLLEADDLAAVAEAVLLDDEGVEVALSVGLASGV